MKRVYSFTHLASYLSILSGLGYFIVIEYFKLETPYGLRPHSSQGLWQAFHILVVPALVFAIGLLWREHIYVKLKATTRFKRISGIGLLASFLIMTFSGYFLIVSKNQFFIDLNKYLHLASSLLWLLFYLYHHFKKKITI
ncbi:MAG: hypothetical protein K9K67_08980 [Bacteriovoracaceae bacterium]|nr:hypothetical protein [Bacteriovoracaceae bacterium]